MTTEALYLQQVINGLSLGAMYALLALGFTLVYGILELINFAHFNVFMVGSFIGMWALRAARACSGQSRVLTGLRAGRRAGLCLRGDDAGGRRARRGDRARCRCGRCAACAAPAAMITTIGVSYILFNIDPADGRRRLAELPQPDAAWSAGNSASATLELREVLIWAIAAGR